MSFMLSPEFSRLSTANGGDYEEPAKPKKQPSSKARSRSYPKNCFWFISTPEGTLLLQVHLFKGPKGQPRRKTYRTFLPGPPEEALPLDGVFGNSKALHW